MRSGLEMSCDVEQDVGVLQLLERGLEGLDQMVGQFPYKADGV